MHHITHTVAEVIEKTLFLCPPDNFVQYRFIIIIHFTTNNTTPIQFNIIWLRLYRLFYSWCYPGFVQVFSGKLFCFYSKAILKATLNFVLQVLKFPISRLKFAKIPLNRWQFASEIIYACFREISKLNFSYWWDHGGCLNRKENREIITLNS